MVGWLYEGVDDRLSATARELIGAGQASISPVVELELAYLFEIHRVSEPPAVPIAALGRTIGLSVADISAAALVQAATGLSWTRDPFDRLIAAHAIAADAPLVTADRTLLEHLPQAVWD